MEDVSTSEQDWSRASPQYFTILVRETVFRLSRTQIESDAPNYFTSALLGEFSEARTKTLHLDCHPSIFCLIQNHLSGYRILPVSKEACPDGMSLSHATENLLRDAKFLGLSRLEKELSVSTVVMDVTEKMAKEGLCVMMDSPAQARFLIAHDIGIRYRWNRPNWPNRAMIYWTATIFFTDEQLSSLASHIAGLPKDSPTTVRLDSQTPHRAISVTYRTMTYNLTLQDIEHHESSGDNREVREIMAVCGSDGPSNSILFDVFAKKACLMFCESASGSWSLGDVVSIDSEPPRKRLERILEI